MSNNGVIAITNTGNTFTGAININGPEVTFAGDGSLGNTANTINIDGGRFTVTATSTITAGRGIQVGSTAGTSISTPGSSTVVTYTGVINDLSGQTGAFTKQGSGTLQLGGTNTYSGSTAVSAGTLLVNGDQSGATGAVSVASNATLGGIGTVGGATTVASGGTVTGATNGTIGTLNLSSALTIYGTYVADVTNSSTGTMGSSDLLAVKGQLTIGAGSTLTVAGTAVPSVSPGSTVYVLATYTSFMGTFTNFTIPSGYTLQYNQTELDLVAVPEPATWLTGMLLLGTAGYSRCLPLTCVLGAARAS